MKTRYARHGFTLIEIMLVVIILGVLVVIVAPVVAGAGQDARKSALSEQLRVVRGQIQMFMLQHGDTSPALNANTWDDLTTVTVFEAENRGPYLPDVPRNSLNNNSDVLVVAADAAFGDPVADAGIGFIYNPATGHIWATNTAANRVYNELNPRDPNN